MTEHAEENAPKEPPKINIGLNDDDPKAPAPEKESSSSPPPKLSLRPKKQAGEGDEGTPSEHAAPADDGGKQDDAPPKTVAGPAKTQSIVFDDIKDSSLEDLYKAALNATQRVILDEKQRASETSRLAAEGDPAQALKKAEENEAEKKSSARLDLQEMLSDEDRQKLKDTEDAPTTPRRTVKLERPQVDEPGENDEAPVLPLDIEESKKSETARIDLPREVTSSAPPSQRKTIRIKRPDGAGAPVPRTLSVARAPKGEKKPSVSKDTLKLDSDEEVTASPIFAIAAVIAVLVSLAVVYLLAATVYPGIPFPGRLI